MKTVNEDYYYTFEELLLKECDGNYEQAETEYIRFMFEITEGLIVVFNAFGEFVGLAEIPDDFTDKPIKDFKSLIEDLKKQKIWERKQLL